MDQGRIVSIPDDQEYLDSVGLSSLEQAFQKWAESSPRKDVRLSRRRILIIFLLIRYTGAKLNEVLSLDPFTDIDLERQTVAFGSEGDDTGSFQREVQLSGSLTREIQHVLSDPDFKTALGDKFGIDPGFVRRKFYERTQACGFPKRLGGPEMIRKARAIEMMQDNMPLPVVQMILGHSTPNLTSSLISFSPDEIRQVAKAYMERESTRTTSARNSFFGKIQEIKLGDIQARVRLVTIGGHTVTTMITNSSLERLGLKEGRLITAEVKAPWVILQKGEEEPLSSAENRFSGVISRITSGEVNSEYAVRISDGTELCAVSSTTNNPVFAEGESVWALFSCFAVVLHVD